MLFLNTIFSVNVSSSQNGRRLLFGVGTNDRDTRFIRDNELD